jgi:hypothetical protein
MLNWIKVSGQVFFFPLFVAGSVIGCAGHNNTESDAVTPYWVRGQRENGDAYTGVGMSETGDRETDRQQASEAAREEIADLVAVEESEKLAVFLRENERDRRPEEIQRAVKEALLPILPKADTVDTWLSPDGQFWVYRKLDRSEWESQKMRDKRVSVPVPEGLEEFSGMNVSFLSVIRDMGLPIQLIPGEKQTPYRLHLNWDVSVSKDPDLDETLHWVRAGATVSFELYGVVVARKLYGPLISSGKTPEEAREAGASAVLDLLRKDGELPVQMKEFIEL